MQLSPDEQKLLLLQIVEQIAKKIVVQQTKGINRCMLSEKKESRDGRPLTLYTLITEGSNIEAMHSHGHVLDLNRIVCNDIARVLTTYGVEAGRYVSLHLPCSPPMLGRVVAAGHVSLTIVQREHCARDQERVRRVRDYGGSEAPVTPRGLHDAERSNERIESQWHGWRGMFPVAGDLVRGLDPVPEGCCNVRCCSWNTVNGSVLCRVSS